MKKGDGYELESEQKAEYIRFRFTSIGPKGSIEKIIVFLIIKIKNNE